MDRQSTIKLIKRIIDRVQTNTTDEADTMMTEQVADFLSVERFAKEKQQFFFDTPQVIGFAGEVKEKNSFMTTEVMGTPIVVTRDAEGVLRAFVNACGHRGAKVASGCGNKSKMICQFHGWTYALDGSLYGRPQDKSFITSDGDSKGHIHLKQLPISERSGLLVLSLNPAMSQETVDNHLCDIESEFAGFDFHNMHSLETRRFEVKANWKIIAALSYESYHFAILHKDSVAQWLRPNAVVDFFNNKHSRWSFALKGVEKLLEKDEEKWPNAVPGAVSHAFFPGTVMITNPEDAQIIRTEPGDTPATSVVYYTGVCRHIDKKADALAAYDFGGKAFENEDLPAAIACQQGLNAGREIIHIGTNEPVVQFWHRLWRERVL